MEGLELVRERGRTRIVVLSSSEISGDPSGNRFQLEARLNQSEEGKLYLLERQISELEHFLQELGDDGLEEESDAGLK